MGNAQSKNWLTLYANSIKIHIQFKSKKEGAMNLKAIQKICYGVYIISSKKDDKINGQIANTAFQITSDPPTLAISVNKQNLTHQFIESSKVFTVSILSKFAPMTLIGKFGFKSGRDIDKFAETKYKLGQGGAPIVLDSTVGFLECEVLSMTDVGIAYDIYREGCRLRCAQRQRTDDIRILSCGQGWKGTEDGAYLYQRRITKTGPGRIRKICLQRVRVCL